MHQDHSNAPQRASSQWNTSNNKRSDAATGGTGHKMQPHNRPQDGMNPAVPNTRQSHRPSHRDTGGGPGGLVIPDDSISGHGPRSDRSHTGSSNARISVRVHTGSGSGQMTSSNPPNRQVIDGKGRPISPTNAPPPRGERDNLPFFPPTPRADLVSIWKELRPGIDPMGNTESRFAGLEEMPTSELTDLLEYCRLDESFPDFMHIFCILTSREFKFTFADIRTACEFSKSKIGSLRPLCQMDRRVMAAQDSNEVDGWEMTDKFLKLADLITSLMRHALMQCMASLSILRQKSGGRDNPSSQEDQMLHYTHVLVLCSNIGDINRYAFQLSESQVDRHYDVNRNAFQISESQVDRYYDLTAAAYFQALQCVQMCPPLDHDCLGLTLNSCLFFLDVAGMCEKTPSLTLLPGVKQFEAIRKRQNDVCDAISRGQSYCDLCVNHMDRLIKSAKKSANPQTDMEKAMMKYSYSINLLGMCLQNIQTWVANVIQNSRSQPFPSFTSQRRAHLMPHSGHHRPRQS